MEKKYVIKVVDSTHYVNSVQSVSPHIKDALIFSSIERAEEIINSGNIPEGIYTIVTIYL